MIQEICSEEFVSGLDNNEQLMACHAIYWAWANGQVKGIFVGGAGWAQTVRSDRRNCSEF